MCKTKPKFTHDCEKCDFLGHYNGGDLYCCGDHTGFTVIYRYGSDGPEYNSGVLLVDLDPNLKEAYRRARLEGLVPQNIVDRLRLKKVKEELVNYSDDLMNRNLYDKWNDIYELRQEVEEMLSHTYL